MCDHDDLDDAPGAGPATLTRRRLLEAGLAVAGAGVAAPLLDLVRAAPAVAAGSGWPSYRVDPHVHSVTSGDGTDDPGVLALAAGAGGYDALFITDHHRGSGFLISGEGAVSGTWNGTLNRATADVQELPVSTSKWNGASYGTGTFTYGADPTQLLVPTTHPAAPNSLLLRASAPAYGEAMAWRKRGPNLLSSASRITFSVFPTRVDPGCAVYVSASIGGDPTTGQDVDGYTRKLDRVASPGRSHVFTWQLGTAVHPLGYPAGGATTVHSAPLGPYVLGRWNTFTIDVAPFLAALVGAADAPTDGNALIMMKMAVASTGGGVVEAYFDGWRHSATPPAASEEFRLRNLELLAYDTPALRLVPSIELGVQQHVQRFDFADASTWADYASGVTAVGDVQARGYPVQLNHPGLPGGAPRATTQDTNAFGADLMEACARGTNTVMIDIWDTILSKGVPLVGTWSSDAHRVRSLGPCTTVQSPTRSFDDLMCSLFEGRASMADARFPGRVAFNLDPSDPDCYPARYPLHVSAAAPDVLVHLSVSSGLTAGSTVRWVVNGAVARTSPVTGPAVDTTFAVPLAPTGPTYARAEVLDAAGVRVVMTQALLLTRVSGLPRGASFGVTRVRSAVPVFTRTMTQGITASVFDPAAGALTLTLTDPPGAVLELRLVLPGLSGVTVDGVPVPASASTAAFDAAPGSAWLPQGGSARLKVRHATGTATVRLTGVRGDVAPPSAPPGLTASQTAAGPVALSWAAATDDTGVVSYTVWRDGTPLLTTAALTAVDASTSPSTAYRYAVTAADAAGNASAASVEVLLTTRAPDTTTTVVPVADGYVVATSPTTSFGSASTLRVDADPLTRSYLRFPLPPAVTVVSATLRVSPTTTQSPGIDVYGVADLTWTEAGLTAATAPALAAAPSGSTGPVTAATPVAVDVTALVAASAAAGAPAVSLALTTRGTTALSLSSRSGTAPPQLVLVTTPSTGDTTPPTVPGGVSAAQDAAGAVQVRWSAATDASGVAGYTVLRDGSPLGTTSGLSFADPTVAPATTYAYAVDAFDAAGNHSAPSPGVPVTTRAATTTTQTVTATADAYVVATTPTVNTGTAATLRVDADPLTRSYLRFVVPPLTGTLVSATLRLVPTSSQGTGYEVRLVPDSTWTETGLTAANAPSPVAAATGSSGRVTAGVPSEVDVTPLVAVAGGPLSLALSTTSTTALSLSSRQGASPPALVLVTRA